MRIVFDKKFIIWIIIAALAVVGITLGLVFGLRKHSAADPVAAVVSNGRGCAEVGSKMLYGGGTAVDAAIATLLCESAMLPQSMGIGGGFVATIYTKAERKIETLIAREAAPAAAHKDMFVGQNKITGARAVAVPGELLGYWELHQRHGRLPWRTLFEPTIELCKHGHYVSQNLANALASKEKEVRAEPSMAEVFIKADGTLYKEGDTLKRPAYAATLEKIATNGVGELYDGGEIGRMLAEDIQKMGGIITLQDLRDYRVRWEDADHIMANVTGGYTLYTTPLPSSGAILAYILNVISDMYIDNREVYWQRVIESFKHAYGHRTNLGDLAKEVDMAQTIKETFENLISEDFARSTRALISDNSTSEDINYYGANFTIEEDHGTANMAVLAPNGDAIVVTSTVNTYFGAKVISSRTGIILNDEMDDFATPGVINAFGVPASPANYIQPGKLPMSSMCPTIVLDKAGNVRLLVGAAGGTKITTSVATTIIKYLIFSESIESAINGERMHHQLVPMVVNVEANMQASIRNYLEQVGHKIAEYDSTGFAAVTAIGVRDGVPIPLFDKRRFGSIATVRQQNKMLH